MAKLRELKSPTNPAMIVSKWANEIAASIKKSSGRVGNVSVYPDRNFDDNIVPNKYFVEIEHNLGGEPHYTNHKNIAVDGVTSHEGFYDWDTDVYIKPCHVFEVVVEKS